MRYLTRLASLSLGPASLANSTSKLFWHSKTTANEKTVHKLFCMWFLMAIQLQAFRPGEKARRRSLDCMCRPNCFVVCVFVVCGMKMKGKEKVKLGAGTICFFNM